MVHTRCNWHLEGLFVWQQNQTPNNIVFYSYSLEDLSNLLQDIGWCTKLVTKRLLVEIRLTYLPSFALPANICIGILLMKLKCKIVNWFSLVIQGILLFSLDDTGCFTELSTCPFKPLVAKWSKSGASIWRSVVGLLGSQACFPLITAQLSATPFRIGTHIATLNRKEEIDKIMSPI